MRRQLKKKETWQQWHGEVEARVVNALLPFSCTGRCSWTPSDCQKHEPPHANQPMDADAQRLCFLNPVVFHFGFNNTLWPMRPRINLFFVFLPLSLSLALSLCLSASSMQSDRECCLSYHCMGYEYLVVSSSMPATSIGRFVVRQLDRKANEAR